ncbi:MAG: putative toxin-antitoxin system toxin component, PIN family [Synergistaceae bacterium]|jgi:putative PIN family toxin of toxin-antitoxin system|nr:putative toxin-antitoxin system toxin component, PIN family [Synergistaceae bacterium]
MKCLIDTNVLISAALFPNSTPANAYMKAVSPPNRAVVCDYSMDELRRVYNKKFSHRIQDFEKFTSRLILSVEIILTPADDEKILEEGKIRDLNDRPILRAAIAAGADLLITGDRDFLESGITKPAMMTPFEFLRLE